MGRVLSCLSFVLAVTLASMAAGAEMIVPDAVPEFETVTVERVIDGDTIVIKSDKLGEQMVRLIGVNCPEDTKKKEPFGDKATKFTKKAIESAGNIVTLETDGEIYDRFNRRLSVVWLGEHPEGTALNEQLLREGLAVANLDYQYSDELKENYRAAVDDAMTNAVGLYSGENRKQLEEMQKDSKKQFLAEEKKFWVSNTGKIHCRDCKFFQKGNGRFINEDELDEEAPRCKLCFNEDGSPRWRTNKKEQDQTPKGPYWVSHTGKVHCKGCRYYGKDEGEYVDDLAGHDNLCGICMVRKTDGKKGRRISEDKK